MFSRDEEEVESDVKHTDWESDILTGNENNKIASTSSGSKYLLLEMCVLTPLKILRYIR